MTGPGPLLSQLASNGQADDDEDDVFLLLAAADGGHGGSGSDGKSFGGGVGGGTGVGALGRCVAGGTAAEVGDIVKCGAVGKFPALVAVFVFGMDREHRGHFAIAGDEVFAGGEREDGILHDEAVFFEPPVRGVELPLGRCDAGGLQAGVFVETAGARAGVLLPEAPRLGAGAGLGRGFSQRGDELRLDATELGEVRAGGGAGDEEERCDGPEREVREFHGIPSA